MSAMRNAGRRQPWLAWPPLHRQLTIDQVQLAVRVRRYRRIVCGHDQGEVQLVVQAGKEVQDLQQVNARARSQALLQELKIAHRQLAEYAVRTEELTLANERQRLARELHDTLAQGLAGLILQLEAADTHLESGHGEHAQAIVRQAMARARSTLAEARQAIDDLRSEPQVPVDLAQAVRDEAQRFSTLTGVPSSVEVWLPGALSAAARQCALRAVTEGLANVARHAGARQVRIRASVKEAGLQVVVQDDGKGFAPEQAVGQQGHYGLLGLRERARLAGGTMEIESRPGQGTTLRVCLPGALEETE
jgi:two-component system, NarL family, sensor histidine kinase YdfH